jgi:hypothetical protein
MVIWKCWLQVWKVSKECVLFCIGLGYVACFLNLSFDVLSVICRHHNLRSPFKIPFYLVPPIVFSFRTKAFFYSWGPYAAFHGIALVCHIEGSMITAVLKHLRMFLNSKFHHFCVKCWILLKPVLGGVDGNLHFPVPSMNRLNQTEPATFSILLCWTFFKVSVFLYFKLGLASRSHVMVLL